MARFSDYYICQNMSENSLHLTGNFLYSRWYMNHISPVDANGHVLIIMWIAYLPQHVTVNWNQNFECRIWYKPVHRGSMDCVNQGKYDCMCHCDFTILWTSADCPGLWLSDYYNLQNCQLWIVYTANECIWNHFNTTYILKMKGNWWIHKVSSGDVLW